MMFHSMAFLSLVLAMTCSLAEGSMSEEAFTDNGSAAKLLTESVNGVTSYTLTTTAPLRDNLPADKSRTFFEEPGFPSIRTGCEMFDALYALTLDDARLNAVGQIRDGSFDVRPEMNRPYFQTGEKWTYVWTRDISYSVDLGLASLDPVRCMNSLLFKTTHLKPGGDGVYARQIVQDTGSGGSYPVSTDRVVWAIGAWELLKYLDGDLRTQFRDDAWQIMHDTIEHDRHVIFDAEDGLYRGEQSFLDWREQTYPGWTRENVLAVARSKTLSTNIGHYELLKTAAELAGYKGLADLQKRYANWAADLKTAINREFYIDSRGLYSSLILDEPVKVRLNRFDLLGESLAILCGIADSAKSEKIIANYPQSKYGPPVVWPQEKTVPIYHNHAIWPFVTAYWLKAAKQAGNAAAVDHAVYSMVRGTAMNLSNMENFDFVTGNAFAKVNGIEGPVINSRRQLWSVAGYLSMVQDIVFGLETDWQGIRFLPCVTPKMHRDYFNGSETLELKDFLYRGKTIRVTVHLPSLNSGSEGIYKVDRVSLNGKPIQDDLVKAGDLKQYNHWEIWLEKADGNKSGTIQLVDDLSGRKIFGPKQPRWKEMGQGSITVEDGRLKLHYDANDETDVRFNIYRDGQLCAKGITETKWTDPDSKDYRDTTHFYMVEAVYPDSGNGSHLTPASFYSPADNRIEIGAAEMENKGGNLADDHHFENWGQTEDEIQVASLSVKKSGRYQVSVQYSNGAGPINTGVTCAVKRIEILRDRSDEPVAASYVIMPHTADWTRYLNSSSFEADLESGKKYAIQVSEDAYARNMSYFDHYECYKHAGNGQTPYNYVNISKIQLILLEQLNR